MKLIEKTGEKLSFIAEMSTSLANAIRRSVGEIPILAIKEVDIYKNDSALYDEIIAHRLGLVPLKNQKLKKDQTIEMKLKVKGKGERIDVLSGALGDSVVYPDMPIVLLEDKQELEVVARAAVGKGNEHAKFSPGILFYKNLPKIKIQKDSKNSSELAGLYPLVFEIVGGKLEVKNAVECDFDQEDLSPYEGVSVEFDDNLIFTIESWGQIDSKNIFLEACKALKENLSQVSKEIK
ncbi:MAG: DNA-directed RNA polymerase subunit D [archaeon]|nr:DNA-directed RNA polymerase subunit D [archaeon]